MGRLLFRPGGGEPSEDSGSSIPSSAAAAPSSTAPEEPEPDPEEGKRETESEPDRPVYQEVDGEWKLLLVNGANPLPDDFQVELEHVTEDFRVDARVVEPLLRMIAKAKEDGINLMICSAWRSVAYQQTLKDNSINGYIAQGLSEEQAIAETALWIAEPGTSEHHTGLAVDIVSPEYQDLDVGFALTRAAQWMAGNAHEFGFILRYPEDKTEITKIAFEPWHFRYVGEEAAREIYDMGVCLEEYLYIKQISTEEPVAASGTADPAEGGEDSSGESGEQDDANEPGAE